MGELFRQIRPDTPLTWTGERMVTSQSGPLEAEHFHRYFIARELCRGMDVLDVASGEGYGSAFLAQTARKVVGVEVDPQSVDHATSTYRSSNLQYLVGNAAELPLVDHSVDVVISFETIEHVSDHRQFLSELKRVLRPNGLVLISTPDMNVYSAPGTESNPFHVRELTEAEFRTTLSGSFRNVELIRQRAFSGSAILPDSIGPGKDSLSIFEQRDSLTYEAASRLLRAPYLLAVASDQSLPALGVSLFIQPHYAIQIASIRAELDDVRKHYEDELRAAGEEMVRVRGVFDEAQKQSGSALQTASELAQQELSIARSQMSEMEGQLSAHKHEQTKLLADLEAAKIERGALVQKLEELRTEVDYYRVQLHTALNSRSWKITKPLRALNSVLRGRQSVPPAPENQETATPPGPHAKDDDEDGVPFDRTSWDRYAHARLTEFLASGKALEFATCDQPILSVILVLFNKAHLTLLSLESIFANAEVDYELIVVDNASSDTTDQLLTRLHGAHIIRNADNVGFGPACMQAAEVARAPYLCFFNNDALLEPHALSSALENFDRSKHVGAVGGKILLADGKLQEAGSIVWSDGSALGYGRSDDPLLPKYQFRRPVDYCSGAFLFTPRALFSELGGFREKFAPAYYEDTDYCLRVWQNGLQVLYEPRAAIRHYESASSGGNETAQLQMAAKQAFFVEAWGHALPGYMAPAASNVLRGRIAASFKGLRILYLDDRIPHRELGSGFPRSNDILRHLVALGHQVACVALSFPPSQQSDEYRDIPREVELIDGCSDFASVLKDYLPASDLVWVSRPHNMERFVRCIEQSAKSHEMPIVYDAEAIFSDRDSLKAKVIGRKVSPQMLSAKSAMEGALAQAASVTLAVSGRDAGALEALGVRAVQILGHQLDAVPTNAPFSSRATFLFLGAIHGDENPNLDSLRYFCQEIWPTVRNATNAVLVIAGFGTEKFADEFSLPGIRLDGPQEDFRPLYESARVFVVPTRYCAGVPYKAHEAAAHGVPMVVTPIIRDQLGWTDGKECLVGADASEFAEKCIELFSNQTQWSALRNGALDRVSTELNTDAFGARIAEILGSLMATVDGVPADRLRELAAWE